MPLQASLIEDCSVEIRLAQVRASEICPAEVCPTEADLKETR